MKISRTRLGLVWLALIAFSLELGVAVLHHHHSVNRGSDFASRAITAGLCAPASKHPCEQNRSHHPEDGCVLCWAAAIAASSLEPPSLPQVMMPATVAGERLGASDVTAIARVHRELFQARGPPSPNAA
jgi:hypothetical protein